MSCVSLEHLRMSNVNNNLKSFLRHIHCPKIHHTECINKEKTSSHHGQDQKQEWDPWKKSAIRISKMDSMKVNS